MYKGRKTNEISFPLGGIGTGCIGLPDNVKSLARHFVGAGYETAYVGKWHLAGRPFRDKAIPPERRGGWQDYWVAAEVLEHTSHGYDGYMFDGAMDKREFKGYRGDAVAGYQRRKSEARGRIHPDIREPRGALPEDEEVEILGARAREGRLEGYGQ